MSRPASENRHDEVDYSTLPEPVRLEDTITTQDTRETPDPTMGRDADTDWLLRNAG